MKQKICSVCRTSYTPTDTITSVCSGKCAIIKVKTKKAEPKKRSRCCKVCKKRFTPTRPLQVVCGFACASKKAVIDKHKQEKKRIKDWSREKKKRKDKLKSKTQWAKEAQTVFNQYIRKRDEGKNCISCNQPPKKINAGHYLTTKSHPECRYDPDGCHVQCEYCNTYRSGNITLYRIGLVKKIGIDRVLKLEGPHEMPHWTIEDYQDIKKIYKARLEALNDNQK